MRRPTASILTASLALALGPLTPARAAFVGPPGSSEADRASTAGGRADSPVDLEPSPHLTPRQVVEVQLGGLSANGAWGNDRGIALAWRFASPDNRRFTGPWPRFVRMVKRGYGALLDHRRSQIGPIHAQAGSVYLPVLLEDADGRDRGFIWVLSRQPEGEYADCWMTDAVIEAAPYAVGETFPGLSAI